MSRIGKLPVAVPQGVKVTVENNIVTVEGTKGKLSQALKGNVSVEVKDNEVIVTRSDDEKLSKSYHGLYRQLINNMISAGSADAAYLNDAGAWLVTAVGLPNGIGEAVVAAVIVPMIKIAVEAVMRRSRRAPAGRVHPDK